MPSECPYPILPSFNYTFTDQEDDDELGFYNYKARLYDPEIGRFITPDSIVPRPDDPQSLNRYTYARNNPLYYTDPTGHEEGGPDLGEGSSTGISPGTSPEPGPLGPGISTGWPSGHAFDSETDFYGEKSVTVLVTIFINPKTGERQIATITINPGVGRVYSNRDEQLSTLDPRKTQPFHELRQLDVYCYRQPHWDTPYSYTELPAGMCLVVFVQVGYERVCIVVKTGQLYSKDLESRGYYEYARTARIGLLTNQGCLVENPNHETVLVK